MNTPLDTITHISSTTDAFTPRSATSLPPNTRPPTTITTDPNPRSPHQPGPDAKDRPIQMAKIDADGSSCWAPMGC